MTTVQDLIALLGNFSSDSNIKFRQGDSKELMDFKDISQVFYSVVDSSVIIGVAGIKKTRNRKPKVEKAIENE